MEPRIDRALAELSKALPSDAVRTDLEVRERAASDDWTQSARLPEAVVVARDTRQISDALRIAHAHDVPVTPRAGGTGRTGGAVPVEGGIVLAMDGLRTLRGIERDDLLAVVEPGLVLADLHASVETQGLFYPPDPNSAQSCQLGGNIAENAAGPRAFKYGATGDYVLGLECVLMDGTIVRTGSRTRKSVVGYDLTSLLVGSEGTLAVFTEATLRLLPQPEMVVALLASFTDARAAERAVRGLTTSRITPRCIEMLDAHTLELVRPRSQLTLSSGSRALLIVELDGAESVIDAELELTGNTLLEHKALDVLVARRSAERERIWAPRRDLSHALRTLAAHKLSEDVVVPRTQLAHLLEHVERISSAHAIAMPAYGHAGDGNLHVNFLWNADDEKPRVELAIEELMRATIALGGTLSGEHGIGLAKAPYLHLEQSEALIELEQSIKRTFDPKGLLNPGKIFARGRHRAC